MLVFVLGACLCFRTSQRQQVPFPGMPKHTAWTTRSKHSPIQGLEIKNVKLRFWPYENPVSNYHMQPPNLLNMTWLRDYVTYRRNTNDTLEGNCHLLVTVIGEPRQVMRFPQDLRVSLRNRWLLPGVYQDLLELATSGPSSLLANEQKWFTYANCGCGVLWCTGETKDH